MLQPEPAAPAFPRIPAHAWRWLQRTRPVVTELAARLTGGPPPSGFVDIVRSQAESDPFTRDVVVSTVADVAFGGRAPRRRPPGAAWDRGLTWWAAALAGVSAAEFEARSAPAGAQQPDLFDHDHAAVGPPRPEPTRAGLAATLRQLLDGAEGGSIPASAVRQLLEQLEDEGPMGG